MSSNFTAKISLPTPEATARFGSAIAPSLRAGDALLLEGEIGAGKTHFARALIQARLSKSDRAEEVPSPTYTLVQTYNDGEYEIWHADLYRLTSPDEVIELGLDYAFETAITLVEWPDRLGDTTPKSALRLRFDIDGAGRILTLKSNEANWAERLGLVLELNV